MLRDEDQRFLDNLEECKTRGYFSTTTCSDLEAFPLQMCNVEGTCFGEDEPEETYCFPGVDHKAECFDRIGFVNKTPDQIPECRSGCCICIKEGELISDPISSPIKKLIQMEQKKIAKILTTLNFFLFLLS